MKEFNYEKDSDNIVVVTMDMTGSVNTMNAEFRAALSAAVLKLEAEPVLAGVVLTSAKKVFLAGGDLQELLAAEAGEDVKLVALVGEVKDCLRRLEKLPVPVVAAINGAALGGGYELCLGCNYRAAYDAHSTQIGLPEVSLGLLPGGGGVVRLVSLIGLEAALPYLLEGKKLSVSQALKAGLIDATVDDLAKLVPSAKAYILENRDLQSATTQPWDRENYSVPGALQAADLRRIDSATRTALWDKSRGLLPAPLRILDVALESCRSDFDSSLAAESQAFADIALTPQAKNMITAYFFQLNKVNGGASRPEGFAKYAVKKVGVLGAGMMGQGIAYVSAVAGIEVVLKDISQEAADKGKAYSEKVLAKSVARGQMTEAQKADVLSRIKATAENNDLSGCDLIVEAVFEDIALKHKITAATEPFLAKDGVWGSNTSSLPITQLADGSVNPQNFIGIHFFSPVDRMPLVEIICGEKTSDETLAKAFDFARQIKKTPIVVNDSLGFYTSRTFKTFLDEGVRLLTEGVHPVRVDSLGQDVGMPVGPLAVYDEVSQQLVQKMHATWDAIGEHDKWGEQDVQNAVLTTMYSDNGRGGRVHGGGFYEYRADGGKSIWPDLYRLYYKPELAISDSDVKDRILFRQVIEALKCLESGVLRSVADGNIGSLMGIGAPTWTGGFIQFVNTYGVQRFVDRCAELAEKYGDRFAAPAIALQKADSNELFV